MDYYGRTNYGYDNRNTMDRTYPQRGQTFPDRAHPDRYERSMDRRGNVSDAITYATYTELSLYINI